jgi:hypothetical protein
MVLWRRPRRHLGDNGPQLPGTQFYQSRSLATRHDPRPLRDVRRHRQPQRGDPTVGPGKVLPDTGQGDNWAIMGGIKWAVDEGPRVINMSFRTNPPDGQLGPDRIDCDPCLQSFVDDAWNNNVVLVAAVGNAHLDWASRQQIAITC